MRLISVSQEKIDSRIAVSTVDIIMATPLPFLALDDQPRLHFAECERQVFDDAGSTCTDIFQHGYPQSSKDPDSFIAVEEVSR